MREQKRILVADIEPDPDQPRKHFDESELLAIGENMKAIGQQVPIIVYPVNGKYRLAEGERRWRAAHLVDLNELDATVLPEKPTATAIKIMQMSLDVHRANLSAMERSDFLHRIKIENDWSINEIARQLSMKQPLVSKLIGLQRLCPEARKALHNGAIDIERAHVVSQESDHAKQQELLKAATQCSREALRRHARGVVVEPKASSAKFTMPGGVIVGVQGKDVTLTLAIEVLTETVRILKKGLSQGLDITTQQRVMRDTSKAH